MQRITPNLWFNGNAAEAADFYTSVFPDSSRGTTIHYPAEGLPDFQQSMAGKELTVEFTLGGLDFVGINAGPEFTPTPALSFMVNFDPSRDPDAEQHLDDLWAALSEGGFVMMPLDAYPFSPHYGWVADRYGVSWQLILTNPDGEPRPFIMPALLFSGSAQNRAHDAIKLYTSLFEGSAVGTLATYPEPTGPATAGSVMFADFHLGDQWFVAMDSAADQPFSFTEGVSLSVACADQAEIDRLWDALSTVPEAEQCGWCKDAFGLSWQIVPQNVAELLARPGAYQNMMTMKKLVIADY